MKLDKQKKIILAGAGLGVVAIYLTTRSEEGTGAGFGGGFGGVPIPGESLGETGADGAGGVTYNFPAQPEPSFMGFEGMGDVKSPGGGLLAPPPSSQMIVPESKKIRIPDPYNIEKRVGEKIAPTPTERISKGVGTTLPLSPLAGGVAASLKVWGEVFDYIGLGKEDRSKGDQPTPYRDIKKSPVPASLYAPTGREIGTIIGLKSPSKTPVAGSKKFVSKGAFEGKDYGVSYKQYTATGKSWTSMSHSERAKVRSVTRKIEGSTRSTSSRSSSTSKKSKKYRDGRGGYSSRPGSPD